MATGSSTFTRKVSAKLVNSRRVNVRVHAYTCTAHTVIPDVFARVL